MSLGASAWSSMSRTRAPVEDSGCPWSQHQSLASVLLEPFMTISAVSHPLPLTLHYFPGHIVVYYQNPLSLTLSVELQPLTRMWPNQEPSLVIRCALVAPQPWRPLVCLFPSFTLLVVGSRTLACSTLDPGQQPAKASPTSLTPPYTPDSILSRRLICLEWSCW